MTPEPPIDDSAPPNTRETTLESRNTPQIAEEYDALHALRGLAPGARITVHRQTPAYAKGFLDHLTVPQAGEIDIESEIKTSWGGGTFRLQPRQISSNGRMNFGKGCVILTIAGEPTLNGRRYINGVLEEPGASAPAMQPYVVQSTQQSDRAGLEGQLLTMVQQTLARGAQNGTATDLAGLGTLITSMSGIMGGQKTAQGDAMGDMDRAFSLLTKMQKLSGMGGSDSDQPTKSDDSADSFMNGGWQQMLMMKMMGGSQTPQAPQYPPQYGQQPPQNWPQPQPTYPHNGPPQQPRPNWPVPPAGVPYSQPPHANPPPQAPPRPPQAAQPPDPATMDGPHETGAGGEDEPFTVANLQAELEEMSESQRAGFMSELMQKLGIDEKLGSMFANVVPAGPSNGAADPVPPPPDQQPETFPGQPFDMPGPFSKE